MIAPPATSLTPSWCCQFVQVNISNPQLGGRAGNLHLPIWKYPTTTIGMTAREQLISEIEAFLERHQMYPTTFGRLAANDTALVSRLRNGASVRLDTADRLRKFMADYRPPKPRRATMGNAVAA